MIVVTTRRQRRLSNELARYGPYKRTYLRSQDQWFLRLAERHNVSVNGREFSPSAGCFMFNLDVSGFRHATDPFEIRVLHTCTYGNFDYMSRLRSLSLDQ